MIMINAGRIHKIFILLILSALITRSQSSSAFKQKLVGLIAKLEKLVEKVDARTSTSSSSAKSDASKSVDAVMDEVKNEEIATTTPTIKSKVAKMRDSSSKSYCNDMPCPLPKCKDKDIIYFGNIRKTAPFPPILKLCESNICIGGLPKMHGEVPDFCCVYNMTHMTLNNEKFLGCAKEVHDGNKKSNPSTGVRYWTSAKWSQTCNKYVWCPDKEIIGADAKWKKSFPKAGAGDCVGIHMGSSNPDDNGLFNGKCSEVLKLFCIENDVE